MNILAFFDHLLEHMLVKGEVSDELFELRILGFELTQASQLGGAEAAVLFLPVVERGLADTHFAADFSDFGAALGLAQGIDDLGFGELGFLHGHPVLFGEDTDRRVSTLHWSSFLGGGQSESYKQNISQENLNEIS